MTLARITAQATILGLDVLGGFLADQDEPGLPKGTGTLLLLGPKEPGFWADFKTGSEWQDGKPDPMDRWSRRVIGKLACDLGAKAVFPFGGPPWHPFYTWALRTGQVWESPVRLLVHHKTGLMVSFRGALALRETLELPKHPPKPCDDCADKPCLDACPVSALGPTGYDVPACHAYLDTGPDCMMMGCAARRACPVSQSHARMAEQSAYHMRQFHK
jgi:hypothetical protein